MTKEPKILIYCGKDSEQYVEVVRQTGYQHVVVATTEAEALTELSDTEIILGWRFPTHLLSFPQANKVRWIQSTGAGVNDLVEDTDIPRNILFTRIIDQFGRPIAEYVFAYLLYLCKNIELLHMAQTAHKWDPLLATLKSGAKSGQVFPSGTLAGKVIGIAGLGSIGKEVVRKARAFDMTVYGLSNRGIQADIVDKHFSGNDWPDFVKDLDVLVLTLPLTERTNRIVNMDVLREMKAGAWVANAGRGKLVSEPDLISLLKSGHIGGAILDVFETEPLPENSELWALPNVYITPHISGPSLIEDVGAFFVENLQRYLTGGQLCGIVNREAGY